MMNRNINDMPPMGGHIGGRGGGDAGNGAPIGGRGVGGWGGPDTQNKPALNQGWGNNPGSKNNNSWDLESPNMQRRDGGGRGGGGFGGGMDDGTSQWGGPKPQHSGPAPTGPTGLSFLFQFLARTCCIVLDSSSFI